MINPFSTIFIGYEGQMLEFVTRNPRSIRAEDVTDYCSQPYSFGKPMELWHGNTKLDGDRLIGRMKNLLLKIATPPAHHQLCSPEKSPEVPAYLTPREAYDLGMRSPPAWRGKLNCYCY